MFSQMLRYKRIEPTSRRRRRKGSLGEMPKRPSVIHPLRGIVLWPRGIKIGRKYIEAVSLKLLSKNLILLRGTKGYVMCGYLNLKAAEKFKDVAVKITGVSTIEEALEAVVHSCSRQAKKLGIYKSQPIRETLKIIV